MRQTGRQDHICARADDAFARAREVEKLKQMEEDLVDTDSSMSLTHSLARSLFLSIYLPTYLYLQPIYLSIQRDMKYCSKVNMSICAQLCFSKRKFLLFFSPAPRCRGQMAKQNICFDRKTSQRNLPFTYYHSVTRWVDYLFKI